MLKRLPIGVSNYGRLQSNKYYIVDKTMMIQDFLQRGFAVTLLTRPRRFGKTLNMSMMSEYFDNTKNSKEIFKNTKIVETKYIQEMNQYPTIFLSFANCKGDYQAMKKLLFETLQMEYARFQSLIEQSDANKNIVVQVKKNFEAICEARDLVAVNTSIKILSQFLYEVYNKRVMIFIDEYDTPFIEAHVQGYYDNIKNDLSMLLQSALKDNDALEYAMLTGIQRVSKKNIFSHLNNLKVFTVKEKEYAQYFGFTTEETKALLEYYGLTLNNDVKAMYDGYNMGGIDMYNPWSIINYADQKELISYWVNTSSNSMIKEALAYSSEDFKEGYESLIQSGYVDTIVNTETSFYEVKQNDSLWGLFVNAGYLSIEKVIDLQNKEYRVVIPNNEVKEEFKDLIAFYLNVQSQDLLLLYQGIKQNNSEKFRKGYHKLLLANPSYYDLKSENSYHMLMLGICLYLSNQYEIVSNKESGNGRCDIILQSKIKGLASYVLEFKYSKIKTDLTQLARSAIEQIKTRKYDVNLTGKVIYVGLAHHGKEVEMIWEVNS